MSEIFDEDEFMRKRDKAMEPAMWLLIFLLTGGAILMNIVTIKECNSRDYGYCEEDQAGGHH